MTTIAQALSSATDHLSSAGLQSPRDDAELIVAVVTKATRTHLLTRHDQALTPMQELHVWRWLEKRALHCPIQYMRGFQEFYGYEFLVSSDVLIPRPETELLVDVSMELLKGEQPQTVLDIGTGSGCIALTLLLEIPSLSAIATDIMASALRIAQANASRHNCDNRLTLLQGDVAGPLAGHQVKFDLVVSNPPYVALTEKGVVSRSVGEFEPEVAVFGGSSGLEVIEKVLKQVPSFLAEDGHLVLELGYGQRKTVSALAQAYGWIEIDSRKDLAGIDRCGIYRHALQPQSPP